jgi:uncharacterized protein YdeI (YjbR/CyaY-like superfamily)
MEDGTMNRANPKVDFYFAKADKWPREFKRLRKIILGCGLAEELRWGCPCYTSGGSNIVLIHGFKDYCALLLFKGALLKDPAGVLVQQTKNVQSGRQIRFTSDRQIAEMEATIKSYVAEAVEVDKAGLKVPRKEPADFDVPEEFQAALDRSPKLRVAFEALTPGRRRGYLLHFGGAKQSKTRAARVDKYVGQILQGKGLDD